ncbi:unnamed protein product [Chrysoparadoxa australica]
MRAALRTRSLRDAGRRAFTASSIAPARVLCLDNIDKVAVDIFKQEGHQTDVMSGLSEGELCKIIHDYDGMVLRSATKVTPELLKYASHLQVVGRAGVGIDNINVPACTKAGVMVMNTPEGNTVSTAQLAITLLCVAARRIAEADIGMKSGQWLRKECQGVELQGKTLAIVGCGRIGQVVAKWAQGFNMKIIGFDPAMSKATAEDLGITLMELPELWAQADFITLHTPLTPETKHLINDDTIGQMKDGVILVNAARGGVIEEAALLRGLNSGKVYSAAIDVYSSEPPPPELAELIAHPRLVCTPHLGASTEEAQVNVARDVAKQMCNTLAGKDYVGVVNVGYMAMANSPAMKPYLELAELLGKIISQNSHSEEDPIKRVQLRTFGGTSVSIEKTSARQLLQAQMLKGMMKTIPGVSAEPSLINAPFLADECGMTVDVDQKVHSGLKQSDFSNLISVKVTLESGQQHKISGSVFGVEPNVVQIDDYISFPAFKPEGHLLSFRNEDKPGAVNGVLSILASAGINVGKLNVGRQEGGLALCLMDLDNKLSKKAKAAIQDLPSLRDVRFAHL